MQSYNPYVMQQPNFQPPFPQPGYYPQYQLHCRPEDIDKHSVYCGTKYAVHAITESMRREVAGSNVRMIVIAPGVVETPLLSHTSNQEIKDDYNLWKQSIEGGLEPARIADCAWFAYQMPQDVCVREIVIAKTKQED